MTFQNSFPSPSLIRVQCECHPSASDSERANFTRNTVTSPAIFQVTLLVQLISSNDNASIDDNSNSNNDHDHATTLHMTMTMTMTMTTTTNDSKCYLSFYSYLSNFLNFASWSPRWRDNEDDDDDHHYHCTRAKDGKGSDTTGTAITIIRTTSESWAHRYVYYYYFLSWSTNIFSSAPSCFHWIWMKKRMIEWEVLNNWPSSRTAVNLVNCLNWIFLICQWSSNFIILGCTWNYVDCLKASISSHPLQIVRELGQLFF